MKLKIIYIYFNFRVLLIIVLFVLCLFTDIWKDEEEKKSILHAIKTALPGKYKKLRFASGFLDVPMLNILHEINGLDLRPLEISHLYFLFHPVNQSLLEMTIKVLQCKELKDLIFQFSSLTNADMKYFNDHLNQDQVF